MVQCLSGTGRLMPMPIAPDVRANNHQKLLGLRMIQTTSSHAIESNPLLRALSVALLLVGLGANTVLFAQNDDICIENGGTAECTGPEVGPFSYWYVSASWNAPYTFSTEQEAVAHFESTVREAHNGCTSEVHNPAYVSVPPNVFYDHLRIPEPPVEGGDNFSLSVWLGLEKDQRKWNMRVTGMAATDGSPPCSNEYGSGDTQLVRTREIGCPSGYDVNYYTTPLYAYCWRNPTSFQGYPRRKNFGSKQCDILVGNPVNLATGNKYAEERDYEGTGIFPLTYVRRYNSQAMLYGGSSPAGPRYMQRSSVWRGTYDRAVHFNDHAQYPAADVYRQDGRVIRYERSGNLWIPDGDINDRLTQLTAAGGAVVGWELRTENDEVEVYDSIGRLVTIRHRSGVVHQLVYDALGRLSSATHSFGQQLVFAYDDYDRLMSLTVPGGQVYTFNYVSTSSRLEGVTTPGGATRTYHYENQNSPLALTGITDELGLRFASYSYDQEGRVSVSEHAGGVQRYSFDYPWSNTTVVTDAVGRLGLGPTRLMPIQLDRPR